MCAATCLIIFLVGRCTRGTRGAWLADLAHVRVEQAGHVAACWVGKGQRALSPGGCAAGWRGEAGMLSWSLGRRGAWRDERQVGTARGGRLTGKGAWRTGGFVCAVAWAGWSGERGEHGRQTEREGAWRRSPRWGREAATPVLRRPWASRAADVLPSGGHAIASSAGLAAAPPMGL